MIGELTEIQVLSHMGSVIINRYFNWWLNLRLSMQGQCRANAIANFCTSSVPLTFTAHPYRLLLSEFMFHKLREMSEKLTAHFVSTIS